MHQVEYAFVHQLYSFVIFVLVTEWFAPISPLSCASDGESCLSLSPHGNLKNAHVDSGANEQLKTYVTSLRDPSKKSQVLDIAPLNKRSTYQRRF